MAERRRDPRLTPARDDLAAEQLRGVVAAARYAAPRWRVVCVAAAPVTATPDGDAPMTTQLLMGERFAVYEDAGGWSWGQGARDGYVGYTPSAALEPVAGPDDAPPTHRVSALQATVYERPDIKSRPVAAAPMGALLRATGGDGGGFVTLAERGHVCVQHVAPADSFEPDWVTVALGFLGAPYLWGGRTVAGVDCSGLVQVARQAAGFDCPRDSDMQEAAPGRDVAPGRERRGDLIFWRGHVGVMLSPSRMLHANANSMTTRIEPLAEAAARIAAAGYGEPLARRRWPGRLARPAR
ncbi:C40 family peptidase [Rubrimonas cliftonensis]|uniref:NlpC/P60 family protein n=1 Tax=Rubrimonas cliftonensis TaxID=89524 RepID=A0A1H4E5T1_9RHOB|nr:NlpC/P60 family protein [Rubrimonas cliftonensis]SEA80395.1 NlpC/P60 family protein [Rubrimonas cliftonensis]